MRPSFPFLEHTKERSGATQEGYYNRFAEGSIPPTASLACGCFEEVFIPPLYNEYEDEYSEDEGPKWDIYSLSSSTEYLDEGRHISLHFIEDIPHETPKEE